MTVDGSFYSGRDFFSALRVHEIDCGIFFTDNKGRAVEKKAANAVEAKKQIHIFQVYSKHFFLVSAWPANFRWQTYMKM